MERFHQKSPQELAAQIINAYPTFGGLLVDRDESNRLSRSAESIKDEVKTANPYSMTDSELESFLLAKKEEMVQSGVWKPSEGEGSQARIDHAMNSPFRGSSEQATINKLDKQGYLDALRRDRRKIENDFLNEVGSFINANDIEPGVEKQEINRLLNITIDIDTINQLEQEKIKNDFTSSNFLYHGSGTAQLIKMFESGYLGNLKAINDDEKATAERENRETKYIKSNSGYEGISWSMNEINALPGDRYHLAGFLAAPELVLDEKEQLVIPSRPAPNEVLQLSSEINAKDYYEAKTQYEMYQAANPMQQLNSVFSNFVSLKIWQDKNSRSFSSEPLLLQAKKKLLNNENYPDLLRQQYSLDSDGVINFNPDLVQQTDNEVPLAAVWLQAAVDNGYFKDSIIENKSVTEIIDLAEKNNQLCDALSQFAEKKSDKFTKILEEYEDKIDALRVPIEKMYFVAPRKDAERWLRIISRCEHQPAGILLYDDKKVRLENFASSHRGDYGALTEEIRKVINPEEGHINYSDILGEEVNDSILAGYKHHVIAESHLSNRKAIRLSGDGNLEIT